MLRLFARQFLALTIALSVCCSALADVHHWRPQATPTTQRTTATFSGTYSAADTVTVTIGASDLELTVGTDASTTTIAEEVKQAVNASDTTSQLGDGYFRSAGGKNIATFTEVKAEVNGSVVTFYGTTPGKPVTIAITEDAGSGSVSVSTVQAATGPHHFDNADNWTGGAVPADGDTAWFDSGSVDCKYALDDLRSNTKIVAVRVTTDYTGQIGLNWLNTDGNTTNHYREYRTRALQLYDPNDASPTDLIIETGNHGGIGGRYLFDLASQDFDDVLIRNAGSVKATPSVEIYGGSVANMYVGGGWVVVDPENVAQSSGMTIDALTIGAKVDEQPGQTATRVTFGSLTRWASGGTTVGIYSGDVVFDCPLDTGTPAAALTVHGGHAHLRGDGDLDALTVRGGQFTWTGDGTANAAINVWGGATLDLSGDSRSKSFNGVTMFHSSTLHQGGHSPTLTFSGCLREDCKITE